MNWTRRDFLRTSSLGALAGVTGVIGMPGAVGGIGAASRLPVPAASQPGGTFRTLRDGVGIFTARGGTIGWLVNDDGAIVVDSQYPDTASECVDGLRERDARQIDALINSHHHGDHTAGNGAFADVVQEIVAHDRVPELQRRAAEASGADGDQTYPQTTFQDEWTIEVGGERVRAKHYGPAHTGGDCTIFFVRADVVHMGDLVFNRLFPFIDRPSGASIEGWIQLLETVAAEHSSRTLYIFGHGHQDFGVTGDHDDLLLQRDFLTALLETAQDAIDEGKSREELAALESLPDFPDYRPPAPQLTLGAALAVAWDELTEGSP